MSTQAVTKHSQSPTSLAARSDDVQRVTPRVDVLENDNEYLLLADLPGVTSDALQVKYDPPELVLQGDRKLEGGPTVRYCRTFQLDQSIDPEGITAKLEMGVLEIKLPKNAASRPRKIKVARAG